MITVKGRVERGKPLAATSKTTCANWEDGGVLPSHGQAILLVETVEANIPWTKPDDISLSEIALLLREDPSGDRFRHRVRHVVAVDAAGAPFILDALRDIEEIKKLVASEAAACLSPPPAGSTSGRR